MSFSDELKALAHGTWGRFAAAGRTPAALMAAVDTAIALAERCAKDAMGHKVRNLDRIACTKGCVWCCHLQVGVTAPQALHIAAKIEAGESALSAQTLKERLRSLDATTRGHTHDMRLKARLPCAFLDNGGCTIYAFRPFGCRAANSFDAETCRTTLEAAAAPGGLPIHKAAYGMQNDVQYGFRTGACELGLRDDRLELTAAVLTALETPDAAPRWIAGEDIFREASLPGAAVSPC